MRGLDAASEGVTGALSAARKVLAAPGLDEHFSATYFSLRVGMIALAIGLPFYLTVGGWLIWDVPIQHELSAYYHADDGALRDEFVGGLVAVGVFLIFYKGFSAYENLALNIAGAALIGVAFVPMAWECGDACSRVSDLHGVFAYTFFGFIFYVAIVRSADTLIPELMPDPAVHRKWRSLYTTLSWIIAGSMVAAGVVAAIARREHVILALECVGVWTFAAYWIVKGIELRRPALAKLIAEHRIAPSETTSLLGQSPVRVLPPD